MSRDTGILNAWQAAFFREHVAVANPTGLHFDAHLSYARLRNLALDDLEICSRTGNLRHLHRRRCKFCSWHNASYEFSSLSYPANSKMTSSSTGAPSGRLATPYAKRQGFLALPTTTTCRFEYDAGATLITTTVCPRSSGSRWMEAGIGTVLIVSPIRLIYFSLRCQQSGSYARLKGDVQFVKSMFKRRGHDPSSHR